MLTVEDLRRAIKELSENTDQYRMPPIVLHPRDSYKAWFLGERRMAMRMWFSTWRMLKFSEWWKERPWRVLKFSIWWGDDRPWR